MFLAYNTPINFQSIRVNMQGLQLLINDNMGVYIPKIFCERHDLQDFGITLTDKDREIFQDPYHEGYWETWEDIYTKARYIDEQGNEWRLWLDGDLWLVCYNLLDDEGYERLGIVEDEDELERLNNEE